MLTAVVDLVHSPQHSHLVTGAVEPVVAQVHQHRGHHPGHHAVPGKAGHPVLLVDCLIGLDHYEPGQHARHGHQEAAGDAGDSVRQVLFSASYEVVDQSLENNETCDERSHCSNIVWTQVCAGAGVLPWVDDVEEQSKVF